MLEPMWLNLARSELGIKEIPGVTSSQYILKYWSDCGLQAVAGDSDEVPWCAAFVGAMLTRSKTPPSGKANARSYETWGRKLNTPCLGCVVVLSRPPSTWQGHVAFYLGSNLGRGHVRLLGGNQGDAVSIADFPLERVVAYRWPVSGLIQPEWVGPLDAAGTIAANVRTA